jgi:hypothetical protein
MAALTLNMLHWKGCAIQDSGGIEDNGYYPMI